MTEQIVLFRAAEMLPWKIFSGGEFPLRQFIHIESELLEGLPPYFKIEIFVPQIESRPGQPGRFDNVTQTSVTAADGRFEDTAFYIVELEL
jgi:hypothetical protein